MKSNCYMSFRTIWTIILMLAVGIFAVNISSARAELRLGMEIPANAPVVALSAVVENPAAYNEKTIVMKGIVSGQCASLCEFSFRDGLHTTTIYPQGFKFPKLKKSKPVTIYTQVISGEENVVFSALGLYME